MKLMIRNFPSVCMTFTCFIVSNRLNEGRDREIEYFLYENQQRSSDN